MLLLTYSRSLLTYSRSLDTRAQKYGVTVRTSVWAREAGVCASVQSAGGSSQEARSSTYDGEFRDGKMHGRGSLTWGDGKRFMGDFRDNCLHGYGVFESPDDWTYTGALEFDRPTKGVFTGKDGIRYAVVYAKNCDFIWNQPTPETMKPDPSYLESARVWYVMTSVSGFNNRKGAA